MSRLLGALICRYLDRESLVAAAMTVGMDSCALGGAEVFKTGFASFDETRRDALGLLGLGGLKSSGGVRAWTEGDEV